MSYVCVMMWCKVCYRRDVHTCVGVMVLTSSEARHLSSVVLPALSRPNRTILNSTSEDPFSFCRTDSRPWYIHKTSASIRKKKLEGHCPPSPPRSGSGIMTSYTLEHILMESPSTAELKSSLSVLSEVIDAVRLTVMRFMWIRSYVSDCLDLF